ncbi:MAG TPA: alpha-ketoacid dehydrogenase subunit beta, partial [Ramlibacter sp.]|nr:alpha-ketoacid dehydrogenase subunit beta [Ramlibacter sp.]
MSAITETQPVKMTMSQAINLALDDALATDPRVLVFGEDVADPEGGGVIGTTRGLSTKYGAARVRSTPISEQAIIGAAIGSAMAGMRPVAEIMLMNFTTVCMDMLVNHAAKLRFMSGGQTQVPLVVRCLTGAGASTGGQHADFLEAWFAHTAGLKVVIPSTPAEAYGLMLSCIDDEDPCIFVENLPLQRAASTDLPQRHQRIPLGQARVLRSGRDVTVVSYSRQVLEAAAVA